MYIGIDIGRQYIIVGCTEKTKTGYRFLDAGSRLVPDANSTYDTEKIEKTHYVMAVKELMRQLKINPKRANSIANNILDFPLPTSPCNNLLIGREDFTASNILSKTSV